MDALNYLINKYNINTKKISPIEIPNVGRDTLAEWLGELQFNECVEIGTQTGLYAEVLCKANPNIHLTCIDPWFRYPEYLALRRDNLQTNYFIARDRLLPYNAELMKSYSMDALKFFDDASLDFIYIDGNHEFKWVMEDLIYWYKKIKPGGIISGHDYIKRKNIAYSYDVIPAVNAMVQTYRIHPWFLLGTRAKVEGEIRDVCRSWMWIKP